MLGLSILKIISSIYNIVFIIKIKQETRVAPLSFINETLTEDLYDSIIKISKDPNDKCLKEKFNNLINEDKLCRSTLSADKSNDSSPKV